MTNVSYGPPCCDGTGDILRTYAMCARYLAPAAFRRRNSSGTEFSRRRKAVVASSCSTGMGRLFFFCTPCVPWRWRSRGAGRRGEPPPPQKNGVLCADRLAKNRTARASGAFIAAENLPPITRESLLRRSAHRNDSCRPLAAPNYRIKEVRSCPSLQQGKNNITLRDRNKLQK